MKNNGSTHVLAWTADLNLGRVRHPFPPRSRRSGVRPERVVGTKHRPAAPLGHGARQLHRVAWNGTERVWTLSGFWGSARAGFGRSRGSGPMLCRNSLMCGWHGLCGAGFGVCTMCTPWPSDRVVLGPVRAGLVMFSGEWRIFKGWSPVRVPPRAQHSPSSEGFLL
jgi:hypothetical protein